MEYLGTDQTKPSELLSQETSSQIFCFLKYTSKSLSKVKHTDNRSCHRVSAFLFVDFEQISKFFLTFWLYSGVSLRC